MTLKGLYKLSSRPHIFIKDYMKKNQKIKIKFKHYLYSSININLPYSNYYYSFYKQLLKGNSLFLAEKALLKAISKKEKSIYYYDLANILKRKNQWWLIVESYEKAIAIEKGFNLKWYLEYAEALEKMKNYKKIITSLKPLSDNSLLNSKGYFIYGFSLKKLEQNQLAKEAFEKAIALDKHLNSIRLGIGIFYEKRGLWHEAIISYRETLNREPLDIEIFYRLGYVLEKSYDWKEAERIYLNILSLNPDQIDCYYKLAFVQERLKKYNKAIETYNYVFKMRDNSAPYWYYRLGYLLHKKENYKESCEAFILMKRKKIPKSIDIKESISSLKNNLEENTIDIALYYRLAEAYLQENRIEESIEMYKLLIQRVENFDETLFYSLGYLLSLIGRYKEASKIFLEQKILQKAYGVSEKVYKNDKRLKKIVDYTEYYDRFKIEEKTILYESYHGSSISCNPYAIFKYLIKNKHFDDYLHIWVINDKDKIPTDLKANLNFIFIRRESDIYMRYLAKAKYLINNTTFPDWYIRKEGQIYLNTWHGTPMKTLGRDVEKDFMAHKNQTRNFLQASHLIYPNQYSTSIMTSAYDIKKSFSGLIATTGYPRQDLMLKQSSDLKEEICFKLNIKSNDKIVLYAPTWRGTVGESLLDIDKLKYDLKKLNSLNNVSIIFRGHYMIEDLFKQTKSDISIVPDDIDTNTLLSVVDILITDYSSIAFDFMAMERPILYYVYDIEVYKKERGLYLELEQLGGEISLNIEALLKHLELKILNPSISSIQKEAQNHFCIYDDGLATKRVVDLIFFNNKSEINIYENSKKPSILIYGGAFLTNGITTSFINLVNSIDKEKYSVTTVIDPNSISSNIEKMEQFKKLERSISVVPRVGRMLMNLEERWVLSEFNRDKMFNNSEKRVIYEILHQREYKRVFGSGKFDYIINFEGYTVFWATLLGVSRHFALSNSIYQHNDLYGEWVMKYPYLEQTFNLYYLYDHIVSVSKKTQEHNQKNLLHRFNLDGKKITYCDNLQNPKSILSKSKKPLEIEADNKIFKNHRVFINIGRLSPEKGHKKLIRAFYKVTQKYSDVRLITLGDGLLKNEIEVLIKKLNLKEKVFFLGQRKNPYSYLAKSDCFILSSDHEGQPMTLFEAMILKKPIIATDIIGNRSVLEHRLGLLVENSEEGLEKGMLDFLEKKYIEDKIFDYEIYNREALEMFYKKILTVDEK
jgi:CDP-glycerol glycerophosphotransferase